MNIKRTIDRNYKLISFIIIGIIFILLCIKGLNKIYEENEEKLQTENIEKNNQTGEKTDDIYTTESNSIEQTMKSFVNYCNKKELDNAYKMLTNECKKAMFSTIEDFERIYINNVYNVQREYQMIKWNTDENKYTYQVRLYGDILALGSSNSYQEEFYTFIEDDKGNYKLNINNYIYGEDKNIKYKQNNIYIEIGYVDIYEEYETAVIKITNNSTKSISLTGDKYRKNIYLQNKIGTTYSSLNSDFDNKDIILEPQKTKIFKIDFNKMYNENNKANYLILSDVILDYEEYLEVEDKINYPNRTSIKVDYQK